MTKHILFYLLLLLLPTIAFTSCEDNASEVDNSEFTNDWQYRNALFYAEKFNEAHQAIAEAKKAHGDNWPEHCKWRMFRSYAKMPGGLVTDSICVEIVEQGKGAGSPLYTDSVKVNYIGRLMPTKSYEKGRAFDYSGLYENNDYVFNPDFATPANMIVNTLIEGFATALMHMHIGDRWKVYIPQELGYAAVPQSLIPAYSTLVFEIQLKAFYRPTAEE